MSVTPSKKYVLVVDDSRLCRCVLRDILEPDYNVIEAEDGLQALEVLNNYGKAILAVVSNVVMPHMDGYQFLKRVTSDPRFDNMPVIVITGSDDEKNEIKALELGAWDFVPKPYNAKILMFRLNNAIERSYLYSFKQLKYMAEYDTLTGIYNKETFFKATERMVQQHREEHLALVRFDVDRFQLINSFFGRKEGDRLLQYIAGCMREFVKDFDLYTFGHIESDIFCFCAPFDQVVNENFFELARKQFAAYNLDYDIVPTFGIYPIRDPMTGTDLMFDCANLAAKSCKGNYVNFYAVYDEQMREKLIHEQEITNEMKAALEQKQFDIYLQPKYNLQTQKEDGAEALVRWIHPRKGIISPDKFIPIFEQNGFIMKMDLYVWERACQLLHKWAEQGKPLIPISVNVSRVNLYNPRLCDVLIDLVEKYEVPPQYLNLELTESAYTDNPIVMKEVMERLQEYGFLIMMDDFGSGYSSLNILKDISVDVLKVDMRFLSNCETQGRGENILTSVIRMAKWLNIPVIAEGVETVEQAIFLRSIGCDHAQGFYFARPMAVAEYEKHSYMVRDCIAVEEDSTGVLKIDDFWIPNTQVNLLFNSILSAVGLYEMNGDRLELIQVNDQFFAVTGEKREKFSEVSADILQVVWVEDRDLVRETFVKSKTTGEAQECVYRRRSKEGQVKLLHLKTQFVLAAGDRYLFYGSFNDITELQKSKEKTRLYQQALQMLEEVVALIPEPLFKDRLEELIEKKD